MRGGIFCVKGPRELNYISRREQKTALLCLRFPLQSSVFLNAAAGVIWEMTPRARFAAGARPAGRTDAHATVLKQNSQQLRAFTLYFQRGKSEQDNFQGDKESGNHQHFIVTLPKKEGSLAAEPSPFVSLSLAESANGFFSFFCARPTKKLSARGLFCPFARRN